MAPRARGRGILILGSSALLTAACTSTPSTPTAARHTPTATVTEVAFELPEPTATVTDAAREPPLWWRRSLPPSCKGDLIRLHEQGEACACRVELPNSPLMRCPPEVYGRDLTRVLDVRLVPKDPVLPPDGTTTVDLVLTNRTEQRLPIVFTDHFRPEETSCLKIPRVFDSTGEDVTCSGMGHGRSASMADYLVRLDPRGKAVLRLSWRAATIHGFREPGTTADQIQLLPLPPGAYTLKYSVPFEPSMQVSPEQKTPSASIRIRALE